MPVFSFGSDAEVDSQFWTNYVTGRPPLPESTLKRIWEYHATKGGAFGLCHEPGVGAGIHTRRIAQAFDRVVASDLDANHIEVAKKRHPDLRNVEFRVGGFEDAASLGLQKETVDAIIAMNFIHFLDPDVLLQAVDYQLKPGGTFAALVWAQVLLPEPKAERIFRQIHQQNLFRSKVKGEYSSTHKAPWYRRVACGYECVPLPESIFEPGALRMRSGPRDDFDKLWLVNGVSEPLESACGQHDVLMTGVDYEDWKITAGVAELRSLINSLQACEPSEVVSKLWEELEEELGDRKVECTVPMACILATKKRRPAA